jgi:hypothetical protein
MEVAVRETAGGAMMYCRVGVYNNEIGVWMWKNVDNDHNGESNRLKNLGRFSLEPLFAKRRNKESSGNARREIDHILINEGDLLYAVRPEQAYLRHINENARKRQMVVEEIIGKAESETGGILWDVVTEKGPERITHSELKGCNLPLFLEWAKKELASRRGNTEMFHKMSMDCESPHLSSESAT